MNTNTPTEKASAQFSEADADLRELRWSVRKPWGFLRRTVDSGQITQRTLYAHRIIFERMCGRALEPGEIVQHVNQDRLDNRRENLRLVRYGGGSFDQDGYHRTYVPNENGRSAMRRTHRVIMERHLGRKLLRTEDVHHINGNKTDNRIENLGVLDHGAHTILTHTGRKRRAKIAGSVMLKPILLLAILTLALAGWLIYCGETAPEPMLHAKTARNDKPSVEIIP